jgi:hypothetical protein
MMEDFPELVSAAGEMPAQTAGATGAFGIAFGN